MQWIFNSAAFMSLQRATILCCFRYSDSQRLPPGYVLGPAPERQTELHRQEEYMFSRALALCGIEVFPVPDLINFHEITDAIILEHHKSLKKWYCLFTDLRWHPLEITKCISHFWERLLCFVCSILCSDWLCQTRYHNPWTHKILEDWSTILNPL